MEKNEIGKAYLDLYPIKSRDIHKEEIKPNTEDLEAGLNTSSANNNDNPNNDE